MYATISLVDKYLKPQLITMCSKKNVMSYLSSFELIIGSKNNRTPVFFSQAPTFSCLPKFELHTILRNELLAASLNKSKGTAIPHLYLFCHVFQDYDAGLYWWIGLLDLH
jgi:hypothetical protein